MGDIDTKMQDQETDLLIVGAGPAGGALACFLSEYGLTGIVIASAPGTAETPRAHITNMAATECLRDIGLEEECLAQATSSGCMEHTRWCASMAGEEYARIHSWGHDPHRQGDYADASPCNHVDLPQTLLEPILVNRARQKGWDVRFNTTLVTFADEGDNGILSEVKDRASGAAYKIRSRYLFGCDGGRSTVVSQLDIPLIKKPGGGLAINVYVEADLSHLVKSRVGNLHWTFEPYKEHPAWASMCIVRMVHPWNKWMFIMFPSPGYVLEKEPTNEEYMARVRDFIGDPDIPAHLINVSKWYVNEIVAEYYSRGNVHCLGDSVHRHPPFNGLGSNTCIQDAYNLAWKIAYMMRGDAGRSILDSFSPERQPVGVGIITRANQGFRDHLAVWQALGMTEPTVEARTAAYNELHATTPAGVQRRKDFRKAIGGTCREFHAVGQEMNQQYDQSDAAAIYVKDEKESRRPIPEDKDPVLHYQSSTYPGSRLPHAWINTRVPGAQISTQDLAGHGSFVLFTGVGGKDVWQVATDQVEKELGLKIKVYSIGWMEDYQDVYFDWERKREVEEDGCVLVRPDRFVAWRARTADLAQGAKLVKVMKSVLRR